jgi:methyltransferase (TIGR00027 family)
MHDHQVSRTALFTAYSRGFHHACDQPLIFSDPLAFELLPAGERAAMETQLLELFSSVNPVAAGAFTDRESAIGWLMQSGAAASILLSRAAYAEECLERSVAQGVGQYVMLGAGLDSFAHRRPELLEKLTLFEVDHPATQGYKRQRLAELGWREPNKLHYLPIDFTRERLAERLAASDFDPRLPTFFSWLGVSYYLPRQTVLETLGEIARLVPAGSLVVFDYLDRGAFIPERCSPRVQRMLDHVASLGEPMQTGFDPDELARELAVAGLELAENLSPWDIHNRWFMGRVDHYRACEHVHFARAVVA